MAKYEAVYLPSAQADINDAVSYISEVLLNPGAASRLLDAINEKVGLLSSGDW